MKTGKIFSILGTVVLSTVLTLGAIKYFNINTSTNTNKANVIKPSVRFANVNALDQRPSDFIYAAEVSTPTVVHIRTKHFPKQTQLRHNGQFHNFYEEYFFGGRSRVPQTNQVRESFGSGVILFKDGYIVTNNHVVEDGDELEVTLADNRIYKATLIGTDKSTDLAVIKIDETDLPAVLFANSDEVKIGEWVLAVGNPFNLSSTVTAGIVSAKGRNINILKDKFAIESFIQTDAAVNPGNSGGALVNLNGELIGVNTAIATPTGSYAGYAFAVPANIVGKIVDDIIEFGVVQRGLLGVSIADMNINLLEETGAKVRTGAYVNSVVEKSAAEIAGLKKGDVIVKINDVEIKGASSLQEQVALYRPGDKINVTVDRAGEEKVFKALLKNKQGNVKVVKEEKPSITEKLGVVFETVSKKDLKALKIDGGVRVQGLVRGILRDYTNIKEGFIITKLDNTKVATKEELIELLAQKNGGVMLEGFYPGIPGMRFYAFGL